MSFTRYSIVVEGTLPLLMDQLDGWDPKPTSARVSSETFISQSAEDREKAAERLHLDKEKYIYLPRRIVARAFARQYRDAARLTRQPNFKDVFAINEIVLTGSAEWVVNCYRSHFEDGSTVDIYRPQFDKWGAEIVVDIDESVISLKFLHWLIKKTAKAGFSAGPRKEYGQFQLVKLETDPNSQRRSA